MPKYTDAFKHCMGNAIEGRKEQNLVYGYLSVSMFLLVIALRFL